MNNSTILPEKSSQFNGSLVLTVDQDSLIHRLDSYIAYKTDLFSRTFIQKMIEKGEVRVNGSIVQKSSTAVKLGDIIQVPVAQPFVPSLEDINKATEKIEIVYEHEHFFIINKPAGMLVHRPNKKSKEITVVDWLLAYNLVERTVGDQTRPGIVHRLDKNTSGLMIIAKTAYGHAYIAKLFHDRLIKKTYRALVNGDCPMQGSIDFYIGRDPITKSRMTTSRVKRDQTFRSALTHFKTVVTNQGVSLIEAYPVTGRTHQIRVHFKAIGHPLLGDSLYDSAHSLLTRHALHAASLSFTFNETSIVITSDMPYDLQKLCKQYKLC